LSGSLQSGKIFSSVSLKCNASHYPIPSHSLSLLPLSLYLSLRVSKDYVLNDALYVDYVTCRNSSEPQRRCVITN
jgi:hypothetical protein